MNWCRHRNLSRPFTISGETYKTCPDCGEVVKTPEWRLTPAYTRTQEGKPREQVAREQERIVR